jgi:hypothetical protein
MGRQRVMAEGLAARSVPRPVTQGAQSSRRVMFKKDDKVMLRKMIGDMPSNLTPQQRRRWGKKHYVAQEASVLEVNAAFVVVKLLKEAGRVSELTHQEAQNKLYLM